MTLDTGSHLSALTADSEAFARLAEEHLDRPVESCPGWTVADLVGHLGGVYSWVELVVQAGGSRPEGHRDAPPEERADLMTWFQDWRDRAVDALTTRAPQDPAWMFVAPHSTNIGWWRRRQAMETAIHLHDVQTAAGQPTAVAPELAADGVDEALTVFLPGYLQRQPVAGLQGTLHLHCTDTDGEWVVDFTGPLPEVRREHAKSDTALRGPAADLFLWVWNRIPTDSPGLDVLGRREVAEAMAEVRL
ncbi:MAG: maleylpyruvate isomerase family mycothiol-dependent enzyme [Actinomycetota bacterium]|nr:maleylpyruvate isomerase family mycothiol-dependent enzyme [Actinomycetota bacterium]